ncbi:archease [Candidatus Bathyarchaeota archaeon]|nr:archease [Candidatus Bathyarchaeota archaeon]
MHSFYKVLDHVSDAYIEVTGESPEECFEKAGLSVIDLMVDLMTISESESYDFLVKGFDLESLLYNFLEEVLVNAVTGKFLARSIKVRLEEVAEGYLIKCKALGEPFTYGKHSPKLEVKAVTYHLMEIKKKDGRFVFRFLLDL